MSTRSSIGKVNADGSIKGIYCHSDGYPSGVGELLLKHYSNDEAIDALLELGDLSSLDEQVSPPAGVKHSYEHNAPKVTVAYGRDRGEKGTEASIAKDKDEYVSKWSDSWVEYFYLWRDGKWWYGQEAKAVVNELTQAVIDADK